MSVFVGALCNHVRVLESVCGVMSGVFDAKLIRFGFVSARIAQQDELGCLATGRQQFVSDASKNLADNRGPDDPELA